MTEQPIRLTGPADLADAIPHLFGYQPTESLVLLYLTGPRHRYRVIAGAATRVPGDGCWMVVRRGGAPPVRC